MARSAHQQLVGRLLKVAGTTYAEEAGIALRDKPMPLFQLLVLCMLASKPIDATIAMQAARELFRAGLKTPKSVLAAEPRHHDRRVRARALRALRRELGDPAGRHRGDRP